MNGAGLVYGLVPKGVFAFRVVVAAEEDLASPGLFFDDFPRTANRTFDADQFFDFLDIMALGVVAAADELAIWPFFLDQIRAAIGTLFPDQYRFFRFSGAAVGVQRSGGFTFRIAGAGKKLAVFPQLDFHGSAAFVANDV